MTCKHSFSLQYSDDPKLYFSNEEILRVLVYWWNNLPNSDKVYYRSCQQNSGLAPNDETESRGDTSAALTEENGSHRRRRGKRTKIDASSSFHKAQ